MLSGLEKYTESIKRVEAALSDLRQGKMVILTDDEDRENEGDLVLVAQKVTPEAMQALVESINVAKQL